jgi:hypothetical protein
MGVEVEIVSREPSLAVRPRTIITRRKNGNKGDGNGEGAMVQPALFGSYFLSSYCVPRSTTDGK